MLGGDRAGGKGVINVSCAGDPVHAGDKALTRETPTQRGRVNRYGCHVTEAIINTVFNHECYPQATKKIYL